MADYPRSLVPYLNEAGMTVMLRLRIISYRQVTGLCWAVKQDGIER